MTQKADHSFVCSRDIASALSSSNICGSDRSVLISLNFELIGKKCFNKKVVVQKNEEVVVVVFCSNIHITFKRRMRIQR